MPGELSHLTRDPAGDFDVLVGAATHRIRDLQMPLGPCGARPAGRLQDLAQPILDAAPDRRRTNRQSFQEGDQFRQEERAVTASLPFHHRARDVVALESDHEVASAQITQAHPGGTVRGDIQTQRTRC